MPVWWITDHKTLTFIRDSKKMQQSNFFYELIFSREAACSVTWYPWVLFWLPKSGTPGSAHVVWMGSEESGTQANLLLLLVLLLLEVFDKHFKPPWRTVYISVTIGTGEMAFFKAGICNMHLGRDCHKLQHQWWFKYAHARAPTNTHVRAIKRCTNADIFGTEAIAVFSTRGRYRLYGAPPLAGLYSNFFPHIRCTLSLFEKIESIKVRPTVRKIRLSVITKSKYFWRSDEVGVGIRTLLQGVNVGMVNSAKSLKRCSQDLFQDERSSLPMQEGCVPLQVPSYWQYLLTEPTSTRGG